MADKTLDTKGLNCPLPILKAKKAILEVPAGGTLEVLATDPGSVADFQAFCRRRSTPSSSSPRLPESIGSSFSAQPRRDRDGRRTSEFSSCCET